jgi:hypothetical protein
MLFSKFQSNTSTNVTQLFTVMLMAKDTVSPELPRDLKILPSF